LIKAKAWTSPTNLTGFGDDSAAKTAPTGLTPKAMDGICEADTNEAPNWATYCDGEAGEIPKFLNCLFKATAGESH
jgi:hypothetical protein